MRYRIVVSDAASGLRSDVAVDCEPLDPVSRVLALIATELPVTGTPAVHGVPLDPDTAVAASAVREGAVLHYGGPADAEPDPFSVASGGLALRVLSGPSAGTEVDVRDGLEIGRAPGVGLVLVDGDVSRRHAALRMTPAGAELRDLGSANGVFVDGRRIREPHLLREGEIVQVGASRLVLADRHRAGAALSRRPDGSYLVNRRFPDRPAAFAPVRITLPTAQADDEGRGLPVVAMLLPVLVAVVLAFVLRSPYYLAFGLLSPVMVGGNWWSERRRRRARGVRQQESYSGKLTAALAQVESAIDEEDAALRRRLPDPVAVARTAVELRREIWSRRTGDDDWLALRMGTADRPASVEVTGERPDGWSHPFLRAAPVGVDLDGLGVLGIAGPPPWARARLGWVLTQCAVLHSPDELQIVLLAPDADEELGWVRWLPHARAGDGTVLAGWSEPGVDALVRVLGEQLAQRAADLAARRAAPAAQLLVVLVGAGALARRPQVVDLLARGPSLGLRFVCVEHDERLLPDSCRAVLVERGGRAVLGVDRSSAVTTAVDLLPPGTEDRVGRALAPLRRVGDTPAAGLPGAVRFVDEVALPGVDELVAQWRRAPEGPSVVVGRDADGPFRLDIAADGPHAVIAGTSGAGKSELLQTWVAALAAANSPEHLSVVFMDYKGGAAFRDLVGLPHVVGTVTNLDERLAARALASLRAELTRRQEQLAAAGATDRADYLRRAGADPALAPFPRLLVVVDELAELKDRLPDLVDGLVGVARIGRSLGVHLVLATQKPAGVVDAQIRANVDLRICLRTRDDGESVDVIDVPDAARIAKEHPGRALVKRGEAVPVPVQTARITTPTDAGAEVPRRAVALHWTEVAAPVGPTGTAGLTTDLEQLVTTVADAADRAGLRAPYHPWSPPLPDVVTLAELPVTPGAVLLGLRDRPARQRREPLTLPLGGGHLGVIGSGRTGRTSALRAIAAGLAMAHPPARLHLHVVDASGGLAALTALPQVGVVADEDDPERLERLLTRLVDEVRTRRRLLAERGAAAIAELGTDAPASIVLLVDDWAGAVEGDGVAQNAFRELLTGASAAAGVTVCLAGDERLLRMRVLNRLDHRLCLRLNNPQDGTVLGLPVRVLPAGLAPGRALWAADGSEVQLPLLAADPAGPAQAGALAALAADLRAAHPDDPAGLLRLQPLPHRISLEDAARLPALRRGEALLGVAGDRLSTVAVDLDRQAGSVLIAGPPRSGRSTAAATVAATAAATGRSVLLVAARPGPAHRAAADRGAVLTAPAGLAAALDTVPDVVVVDDADTAALDDDTIHRLAGPDGPVLVVAAALDSFGFARGLVQAAKKEAGPVVLLCPPSALEAQGVGVRIDRAATFHGPPGRAFLQVDGELLLGQVPDVSAG